jgi:hypothetical protein
MQASITKALTSWASWDGVFSRLGECLVLAITNIPLLVGSDKWPLRTKAFEALGYDGEKSFGLFGETLAYGQSAFSLLLLFLVGLALRNRFRIGGGS